MPRLFIGTLAAPAKLKRTEQLLAPFQSTARTLFGDDPKIKFTLAANVHMTWAFIGDVALESVENLQLLLTAQINVIRKLRLPPELLFDSIELWPDASPDHLVLTPTEIPSAVQECARQIHQLVAPFRSKPETLPFRAHVTLARFKKSAVSGDVSITAFKSFLPLTLELTDISLFESYSNGRNSDYRAICRYEL